MPLTALSLDDSSPPVVQYGSHVPLAASTPNRTAAYEQNSQQEDTYQEIIPGIPQGSLYPTLSALSSGPVAIATNEHSLHNKVTKDLDQYLQEAEQLQESEDNYFDGTTISTNAMPMLEAEDQEDQTQSKDFVQVK